jgi:hypothetical protein
VCAWVTGVCAGILAITGLVLSIPPICALLIWLGIHGHVTKTIEVFQPSNQTSSSTVSSTQTPTFIDSLPFPTTTSFSKNMKLLERYDAEGGGYEQGGQGGRYGEERPHHHHQEGGHVQGGGGGWQGDFSGASGLGGLLKGGRDGDKGHPHHDQEGREEEDMVNRVGADIKVVVGDINSRAGKADAMTSIIKRAVDS